MSMSMSMNEHEHEHEHESMFATLLQPLLEVVSLASVV